MLTPEETEYLDSFLYEADKCQSLSGFETDFVESLRDRFGQYKGKITLSDKQWAVIDRIAEETIGMEAIER